MLVALLGALLLNRTAFGRHVQAIGSNEQVARYAAIRVDLVKTLTYALLGLCVGIATLLYVPRLGSATPTTGLLWELEAIAAVVVGGTALKGGEGRVFGTVIGAILLSVISNILNLTSIISVYLNAAVQGGVIIVVAFFAALTPLTKASPPSCPGAQTAPLETHHETLDVRHQRQLAGLVHPEPRGRKGHAGGVYSHRHA